MIHHATSVRARRRATSPKPQLSTSTISVKYAGIVSEGGWPQLKPLSVAPTAAKKDAAQAVRSIRAFEQLVHARYGRRGWNDAGGAMQVWIGDRSIGGNASFGPLDHATGLMDIGVADARIGFRQSPAWSPTILGHEYAHGILDSELAHLPSHVTDRFNGREGNAIHESFADVLSAGLLDSNWTNGAEIRGGVPLRDLANPSVPKFTAAVMRDSGLEEHTLSGILSLAAVRAADSAGRLAVTDAWYAAATRYLAGELRCIDVAGSGGALGAWVRATTKAARAADLRAAKANAGAAATSTIERAVREGWSHVGLGRYASEEALVTIRPPKRRKHGASRRPA